MATIISPVHRITPSEYRRVTEVTYLGQVHGTLAALRYMRPRNAGTIVQVGSALAYSSFPLQSAYCAAKFAVRGFTDSLRGELLHEESWIRITMVQLPAITRCSSIGRAAACRARCSQCLQFISPRKLQLQFWTPHLLRHASPGWAGPPYGRSLHMLAPGLLDRLAAHDAWDQQMTDDLAPLNRPENLFEPPPGDPGAHGRFDDVATSGLFSISSATARVGAVGLALGLLSAAALLSRIVTRPDALARRKPYPARIRSNA